MATTSDPKIYYPETSLQVGEVADHLAILAQSVSDRLREIEGGVGTSDWVNLPYPSWAQKAQNGYNISYKLGPDYLKLRGTWQRTSGKPVYTATGSRLITKLPAAITARILENSYWLSPGTGAAYMRLDCHADVGEIRCNDARAYPTWCTLDNWEIPLAKV